MALHYLITVTDGGTPTTYSAIGDIGALVDAAIDAGALGITYRVIA